MLSCSAAARSACIAVRDAPGTKKPRPACITTPDARYTVDLAVSDVGCQFVMFPPADCRQTHMVVLQNVKMHAIKQACSMAVLQHSTTTTQVQPSPSICLPAHMEINPEVKALDKYSPASGLGKEYCLTAWKPRSTCMSVTTPLPTPAVQGYSYVSAERSKLGA